MLSLGKRCLLTQRNVRLLSTEASTENKVETPANASSEELDRLYSRLEVELRGIDPAVLQSFSYFSTTAANHLGIQVGKW